ncbi:DoxX family protein [Mucilaginibacter sp. Bleaf8]|uniref:DoxX family protein n=1 Tax=Mucilaginibacter sp. Bleaf8 TaxID=2834430 RepID=UPI001BD03DC9|nr:DoxX family protein [Mucilaginibacter sp. Bleaf8]MBS7563205.1 DoxX family protein [Mucilaginibacter sp. Bleaf8]
MKLLTKIQHWGDCHHPKWLDYFRIALGIVLIWKGLAFAANLGAFTKLMMDSMLGTAVCISILAHLIIILHIAGGFFIAIGSYTRLFCLLNLPVLLVAVLFVNVQQSYLKPYSEYWLSVSVLLGLVCFLIEGNGVLSVEQKSEAVA